VRWVWYCPDYPCQANLWNFRASPTSRGDTPPACPPCPPVVAGAPPPATPPHPRAPGAPGGLRAGLGARAGGPAPTRAAAREVASLQAAQELEIRVRQLRFHSFLNFIDPSHPREGPIREAHRNFEHALERARQSAHTPKEQAIVQKIRDGYQRYLRELTHFP